MKFVWVFPIDLALAKIWYKFHGPRQIKKPFKSIWAMEIWDKSMTKFMVWDKFVSDFQCSFFICLGLFNAYHH